MFTLKSRALQILPPSLLDRIRLASLALGALFVVMTAPMVIGGVGPAWLHAVVMILYATMLVRWYAWFRGGAPTAFDLTVELVAVLLTTVTIGDPIVAVTFLYAGVCYRPYYLPLRRLPFSLGGYILAYFLGVSLIPSSEYGLSSPIVFSQAFSAFLTGAFIFVFAQGIRRQTQLLADVTVGEHRYRSLVEQLPGVILTSRMDGTHIYASPQMETIYGYRLSDLLNDPQGSIMRFIHPKDQVNVMAVSEAAARDRSPFRLECRIITAAGETVWVQIEGQVVDDGSLEAPYWQTLIFDVNERHLLTEELTYQAFHDVLTGLPNRALFQDRVEQALLRCQRSTNEAAVCFLDLDNFKIVNDSLGHVAGDTLVTLVARRLESAIRPGDTIARLGGDEFAILLEGQLRRSDVIGIVERVISLLAAPFEVEGYPIVATASIGIAFAEGDHTSGTDLIRRADVAMYAAKRSGKATYVVFTDAMDEHASQRLEVELELRTALERDELRVVYQPIVNLETGTVHEVEALIRWQHPTRGLLPPFAFLPIAEDSGLIIPIGQWLLEVACRQLRFWQQSYPAFANLLLSVNLSPRQLHDPHLADSISAVLAETGVNPHYLQLEVSESAMLDDIDRAKVALRLLGDLGVRLAVDDFGTGNSSLGHLRELSVQTLKIDRSFVSQLGSTEQATTIVQAMVMLGTMLGMDVTAEGIETFEQTQIHAFGCNYGQGYFFARPLPHEDLEAMLAENVHFHVCAEEVQIASFAYDGAVESRWHARGNSLGR